MKTKILFIGLALILILASCGPKPYYETRTGKKKQKYYNDIQYGGKSAADMKPINKK